MLCRSTNSPLAAIWDELSMMIAAEAAPVANGSSVSRSERSTLVRLLPS